MKLSEAIRLGAMLAPQGFGPIPGRAERTLCALQAASVALGFPEPYGVHEMRKAFPELYSMRVSLDGEHGLLLCDAILWLNDIEHWTRERIADWVSTIEPQGAPAAQPQEAEVCA